MNIIKKKRPARSGTTPKELLLLNESVHKRMNTVPTPPQPLLALSALGLKNLRRSQPDSSKVRPAVPLVVWSPEEQSLKHARAAARKGSMDPAAILYVLVAILAGLLQPSKPLRATDAGTNCLFYEFIINPKPLPGQQQCKVQGQLDHRIFLSYDCVGAKAISMGVLGGKLNSTKSWNDQLETLQDVATEFKQQVWDIKPEECASTGKLEYSKTMREVLGLWGYLPYSWGKENNWMLVSSRMDVDEEHGKISRLQEVSIGWGQGFLKKGG
ncbi:uncharacterized protein LOC101787236 [Cavia porcellus]|uniref:uncharacterized protein LOC101787236 n=1 Tax=Cavia porcellus TaxID=10141 RepID=UPI000C878F87|nr:uncharacterized protein LOC101787236 [Cavia porcellus]